MVLLQLLVGDCNEGRQLPGRRSLINEATMSGKRLHVSELIISELSAGQTDVTGN